MAKEKQKGKNCSKKYLHKILSLFANIGVAEAYLDCIGFHVAVANELLSKRAKLYSEIYPQTRMICGDITNEEIFSKIIDEAQKANVDIVMATPPCQGMSTVGQQKEDDTRNLLLLPALSAITKINPKYALIENVPNFINTSAMYNGQRCLLTEIVKTELGDKYYVSVNVINTKDFKVAQSRERMIILLTRKDQRFEWKIPASSSEVVTLRDAIGDIPPIDPFVKDIDEEKFHTLIV